MDISGRGYVSARVVQFWMPDPASPKCFAATGPTRQIGWKKMAGTARPTLCVKVAQGSCAVEIAVSREYTLLAMTVCVVCVCQGG